MQIVIIAGGLATKLEGLSINTPKSMIRVGDKPFLQYQIELLKKSNVKNIVLCIGHLGNQIKEYFGSGGRFNVEIKYSEDGEKLLGTGGALKKAESLLEDNFMLMWGDSYLLLDYKNIWDTFLGNNNKEGLMVVYKNYNKRVPSNVIIKDGVVKLYDKQNLTPEMIYVDGGLSILRKSVLSRIPAEKPFAVETIFNQLSLERNLLAYETQQCFYEIGSVAGLKEFENLILKQKTIR